MTDIAIAIDAIQTIRDLWRVDEDRSQWVGDPSADGLLRRGYGFDWWPGKFRIQVRASGPHPELDTAIYRVDVRTDLLCDADVTTPRTKEHLSGFNHGACTFALCTYPMTLPKTFKKYGWLTDRGADFPDLKSSKVWLSSAIYVHEGTKDWLPPVFAGLAMLQLHFAEFAAGLVAESIDGGRVDQTAPPGGALPASLANILKVLKFEFLPAGLQPSRWIGTGELEEIVVKWQSTEFECSSAFEGGIAIETSFGDRAAVIVLRTTASNAFVDNGLEVYLKLPYLATPEVIQALSIEMNFIEHRIWSKSGVQFIGAWSAEEWGKPGESGFGPMFSCFIPNLCYQYGLAEILVMDALRRAAMFRPSLLPGAVDVPMEEIQRRLNQKRSP